MRYTYEVFAGDDGLWRYRLLAPNGEIMHVSQAYQSGKRGAIRAAAAAKRAVARADIVVV